MPDTSQQAFLDAIIAEPDNDAFRLNYADYLDERGDDNSLARSEFIRLQLAASTGKNGFAAMLRYRDLFQQHAPSWSPEINGVVRGDSFQVVPPDYVATIYGAGDMKGVSYSYRRGFVEEVACRAAHWLEYGPQLVKDFPVRRLRLDREPAQWLRDVFKWTASDEYLGQSYHLPSAWAGLLGRTIISNARPEGYEAGYTSRDRAIFDLHVAALAWARVKAKELLTLTPSP